MTAKQNIALLLAAVMAAFFVLSAPIKAQAQEQGASAEELYVLGSVNLQRQANSLLPLTEAPELDALADMRAAECAKKFSHTRPDGTGWWTLNPALMYGENLAASYTFDKVTDAWMASPEHKENILADFTTTGVGSYTDPTTGVMYFVQVFGY